jgi:hypothetical protein
MGRTILIDSALPKTFWSYAFLWANHVLNRIQNKASGDVTPYEGLFHIKPRYDGFRAFGQVGYIHIPVEKRLRLEPRAVKAHAIGHLEESKGWLFWIPEDNTYAVSVMARFENDLPFDKPPQVIDDRVTPCLLKDIPKQNPKLSLDFIMNLMHLGDFSNEIEFTNQELIVDKIIEMCAFYSITVPKTFKQAMKSEDKNAWSKAIAVELLNLEQMRVWELLLKPSDKKELGGRWVFATKPDVDGSGVRFKARYVAKGFTQIAGKDFNETFAPTATFVSL